MLIKNLTLFVTFFCPHLKRLIFRQENKIRIQNCRELNLKIHVHGITEKLIYIFFSFFCCVSICYLYNLYIVCM